MSEEGRPGVEEGSGDARAFFQRHAQAYAQSESHRTGRDLEMLVQALSPLAGMTALDVATGAGFAAVALAEAGAHVTAVDLAPAMLAETGRLAASRGLEVALLEAEATALPFDDAAVDRVVSRRAAHHFADVPAALREWLRVLRPGGLACVADMSPPAAGADFQDAFERIRDDSHRRALPPEAWAQSFADAGFADIALEVWSERVGFDRWLYPVADAAIRAAVQAFLAEAPAAAAAALDLRRDEGEWSFVKQRVVVWGRRPPA